MEIGSILSRQRKIKEAIQNYKMALSYSLENPEVLRTLGLLHLTVNDSQNALDFLNQALKLNHKDPRTILAIGSMI